MEHKNDIGKQIAQKVQEMSKSPNDDIWDQINTTLAAQEKKRKRFLLWWFLSVGIGLISILFLVINTPFSKQNESIIAPQETSTEEPSNEHLEKNKTSVSGDEIDSVKLRKEQTNSVSAADSDKSPENKRIVQNSKEPKIASEIKSENSQTTNSSTQQIAPSNKRKSIYSKSIRATPNYLDTESKAQASTSKPFSETIQDSSAEKEKNAVVVQEENFQNIAKESSPEVLESFMIIGNKTAKTTTDTLTLREKIKLENQQRIDSIKATREKKRVAFTANEDASVEDSIILQKTPWSVTVLGAPLFFNVYRDNATIDQDLTGNDKTGKVNFAYGATVNFELTENTTLSLGVIANKMSYLTNNISTATSADQGTILSYTGVSKEDLISEETLANFINNDPSVKLLQEINYTELPLQVTYKFYRNRFGAHVQGGFSFYILGDDSIFLEKENGEQLRLGTANNLSKVNFSVNAGIGVYYKLSEKVTLEATPTFKYQFNTLNNVTYDSKSYLFGIYTGIKYQF